MKDWYWFKKNRDALVNMSETLRRLQLHNYGADHYLYPTVREMLIGYYHSDWRSFTFFEKKFGFRQTYFDGHHCSLYLGIIGFHWTY